MVAVKSPWLVATSSHGKYFDPKMPVNLSVTYGLSGCGKVGRLSSGQRQSLSNRDNGEPKVGNCTDKETGYQNFRCIDKLNPKFSDYHIFRT